MSKKAYRQDAPFAVQIELAEGCNLRCSFCGLNGIRGKEANFKFMEEATLRSAMRQMVELGWNPRVEFAMHGEPTIHPDYVGMVRAAAEEAPRFQFMMTSNGGGLVRKPGAIENVGALFDAGLSVLALDDYDGVKLVPKIREALRGATHFHQLDYPADKTASPHARRPRNWQGVIYIESIDLAKEGNHSHLNNHAGAAAPLDFSMQDKRCAKPFREMSIRWDGNVAISCNDWREVYKCGNVLKEGVEGIWHGEAMEAARRILMHEGRTFAPCKGCNAISHRVGLLPDKFGKVKLPRPTPEDRAAVARAIAGAPYTAPVPRPWEGR